MIPSMNEMNAPAPQATLQQIWMMAGVVCPSMNLCTANAFTNGISAMIAHLVRCGASVSAIGSLSIEECPGWCESAWDEITTSVSELQGKISNCFGRALLPAWFTVRA